MKRMHLILLLAGVLSLNLIACDGVRSGAQLDVFSITGRLVRHVNGIQVVEGMNEIQLPREDLAAGIYMYRVSGSGYAYTRKMVVGP